MNEKEMSVLKEKMLRQRRELVEFRLDFERSWQDLETPEREVEETAEKESLARVVEQHEDRDKELVEAIDAALGKMELGVYGTCESCGKEIPFARLDAVPWARFCSECVEQEEPQEAPAAEVQSQAELPPDLQGMSDEELCNAVYDELLRDGRVELDELEITCEQGEVILRGALPGQTKHGILRGILEDVLGLQRIRDYTEIDELLWERRDRTEGAEQPRKTDFDVLLHGEGAEEDEAYRSAQDGTPLSPPDRFVPEREE